MSPKAMSEQWVEVFCGTSQLAEMLRGELEDNGIPAFTPDLNMKMLDPLDVGGNIFAVRVLVPREHAERALRIAAGGPGARCEPTSDDEPARDPDLVRVEALGRRIRWCAVIVLFAPYGLWLALRYFLAARGLPERPRHHGATLFATIVCLLESALVAASVQPR